MTKHWLIFLVILPLCTDTFGQEGNQIYDIKISYDENENHFIINASVPDGTHTLEINGSEEELAFSGGETRFPASLSRGGELISFKSHGKHSLFHISQRSDGRSRIVQIPLWLSILPPLVAILLALVFKEVIISLFVGIWTGAFIAGGLRIESPFYFLHSFLQVLERYVVQALADSGHLSVILFSLLIGGTVAIISRNGGMAGVVSALSRYATSPRRAQFITWLLGVAIFFDDYANTLVVGNTMRSVTDQFKISREKLAYIVDSTAAPVAAVAFITTWIGAELGYIDDGISQISNFSYSLTPYAIFVSSLKYSFYPILTLCFILFLIYQNRDFGGMFKAEERARTLGRVSSALTPEEDEPNMEDLTPVLNAPRKWQHAFFPVITIILVTIFGLVSTGMDSLYSQVSEAGYQGLQSWDSVWRNLDLLVSESNTGFFRKIGMLIGSSDSYVALLWASLCGAVVAIAITLNRKIMSTIETMHSLVTGIKSMLPAIIILTLAWSLALTTDELYTADFLSSALAGNISPVLLPVLIFVLAALIAFSTGSSWSTMAILYPIAIPTSWVVCHTAGYDDSHSLEILLNVIATVLGASVLGDHCSPISDTTILSSLASDCNHIDHVRTQMPYALTVGFVSLTCCGVSTWLGGGWYISFGLLFVALLTLYFIVYKVGKVVPEAVNHNA